MPSPPRDTPTRTLADQLRSWSDERVVALLRDRPDLATPAPHDSSQLASRAATRASVHRALDGLDRLELCVLDALLVAGQTTSEQLIAMVHADPAAVEAAITRLTDLALAWWTPQGLRPLSGAAEAMAGQPAGITSGVRPFSADPAAADEVATRLTEISPAARAMLEHVDAHGGEATTARARRTVSVEEAEHPAEELIARRLLLPREGGSLVLPGEVAVVLRGGHTTRERVDDVPEVATSTRDPELAVRTAAGAAFEAVRRVEL
ncbi:MAG: hypothetical protein LT071_08610, partial [Nocardioides sp.]|nr:hypothetical protein [Nocardioides sp.]